MPSELKWSLSIYIIDLCTQIYNVYTWNNVQIYAHWKTYTWEIIYVYGYTLNRYLKRYGLLIHIINLINLRIKNETVDDK